MWNIKRTKRHFYFHTWCHVLAKYFNNFTHRAHFTARTLGKLYHDHLPHSGTVRTFWWNDNFVLQAAVIWHDHAKTLLNKVASNNRLAARLNDLRNKRFFSSAAIGTTDTRFYHIVVKEQVHLPCTDK